jgi:type II secretory pathway predicted ATPase ExeA
MDENRFGLKRRPFPPTLDTGLYYPSTLHESALASLQRAIAEEEGLILLTGIPGTGKTLLGYALLERFQDQVSSAFLTNSHVPDRASLLQAILYDLGLPYDSDKEQTLRLRLTEHLLKSCAANRRTLLLIDEAHHLSADLLEELRLLANLEAGTGKAVQMILLAQPAILQTLKQPGLESLQQRIAVRSVVHPLDLEEACDYLSHHVRLAGGKPEKVFDDGALEAIARGTQGVPRCLNQVANQALALANAGELATVDTEAALEALTMLGFHAEDGDAASDVDSLPNIQKFVRSA